MPLQRLRFAIFGNVFQPKKSASITRMLKCLSAWGDEVLMDRDFYEFLCQCHGGVPGVSRVFEGNDFSADFVVSMGGDGTFLHVAGRVGEKQIPIVGVNMGRLGFLADVTPGGIEGCLAALHGGDFTVEGRGALSVEASGADQWQGFALNDVALLKRDDASMISIRASVNGQHLTTYQADGLIVSTPTGSTAYSLSNGGPIIVPGTNVFSMTAVAPHSLSMRPIVIPDSVTLALDVESRSHSFLVATDGKSVACKEGVAITLRKAPWEVRVVKQPGNNYFDTLRKKMMWGADLRY